MRREAFLWLALAFMLAAQALCADTDGQLSMFGLWQAQRDALKADRTVVRYYTFEDVTGPDSKVPNLAGTEVYLDTSSSLFAIPQTDLEAIWRSFPRERFLFGSDYPIFDPGSELEALQRRLHLRDAEVEAVLANGSWLMATP